MIIGKKRKKKMNYKPLMHIVGKIIIPKAKERLVHYF
jgi:hypothetical protein